MLMSPEITISQCLLIEVKRSSVLRRGNSSISPKTEMGRIADDAAGNRGKDDYPSAFS
jgi:hypothetical protein